MTAPVVVLVETDTRGATETSLETLTLARELTSRRDDAPLHAVIVGPVDDSQLGSAVTQLGEQGVAAVYVVTHQELTAYTAFGWATSVLTVVDESSAEVV